MYHLPGARAVRRAERRWLRSRFHREDVAKRTRRRLQSGQAMIIFGISITVLIGFVGLSLDVIRAYDLYAREQRAAQAGALAGVLYMPNYYNSAYSNNYTAITRALAEVQKNGLGATTTANAPCKDVQTTQEVMTCQVSNQPTSLQVTITEPISVFFLSAVGVQSFNVTATAQAAYLEPFVLGAGSTDSADSFFFGTGGACSQGAGAPPANCNLDPHAIYQASINGPAELKEQGDPYVYCAEGPDQGPLSASVPNAVNGADPSASVNPQPTTNGATGLGTNHPQYGGNQCGSSQPTQQPNGFVGPANNSTLDTYNYAIKPTPGTAGAMLWIYNPTYVPTVASGSSCSGYKQLDYFFTTLDCSKYYSTYGPLNCAPQTCTIFDDPRFYFSVTYSLYTVDNPYNYNQSGTTPIWRQTFAPFDMMPNDLKAHGCNGTGAYLNISAITQGQTSYSGQGVLQTVSSYQGPCGNVSGSAGNTCTYSSTTPTPCAYQWYQAGSGLLPPTTYGYRLTVETSNYITTGNQGNADPNGTCKGGAFYACGWGHHAYGLLLCPPGVTPPSASCAGTGTIGPWNNMNITLTFNSATSVNALPLASLDRSFAGRTVTFSIFDPGDSMGNGGNSSQFMIVPPSNCDTISWNSAPGSGYSNWLRTTAWAGGTVYQAPTSDGCTANYPAVQTSVQYHNNTLPSDNIYNGLWINATCTLPPNFAGGAFWLDIYSYGGNNFDQFAVSVALNGGSPVHLTG